VSESHQSDGRCRPGTTFSSPGTGASRRRQRTQLEPPTHIEMKGQVRMVVQGGVVEDIAPMKHALRVDWFQRDPGGSTIFVAPGRKDGATDVACTAVLPAGTVRHRDLIPPGVTSPTSSWYRRHAFAVRNVRRRNIPRSCLMPLHDAIVALYRSAGSQLPLIAV
jgi:hypothetical protein